jgi:hypothetical protein
VSVVEISRTRYCRATAPLIEHAPQQCGFRSWLTLPSSPAQIATDILGESMRTKYPISVHLLQGMRVDQGYLHQINGRQH